MTRFRIARMFFAPALIALFAQPPSRAHADVVTDWNVIAIEATAVPPNAILQSRVLAIVHGAIYDAVRAVDQKSAAYAVDVKAPAATSLDAAVAAAAHCVLVGLVSPAQIPALDAALNATLSKIPDGEAKLAGISTGSEIAAKFLAMRTRDGADAKGAFAAQRRPGYYQLTPPLSMAPILPQWGEVTPFILRSPSGLEFKGPPPVASAEFARDLDEVRRVGARNSTARTADQTAAAIFWTVQTAVPWHAAARAASAARKLSIAENARLFAILSMATADSQIVGFAEKYRRPHWRPITAIRANGDPAWEPLLVTPPQPDYPSAHAIFSGAAEAVLRAFFGSDDVNVSVSHPGPFGVTRSYRRFSEMTEEVDNARVWGGIHFRSADRDGSAVGRRIGEIAVRDFPQPQPGLARGAP